jgi:hypothetical protein
MILTHGVIATAAIHGRKGCNDGMHAHLQKGKAYRCWSTRSYRRVLGDCTRSRCLLARTGRIVNVVSRRPGGRMSNRNNK